MNFLKRNYGVILVGVGLVVLYILLTQTFNVLSDFLFPNLADVLKRFPEYIGEMMGNLWASLKLLIVAFVIALVLGIGLGTLIGLKSGLRRTISPWITAATAIPVPLLTPYALNIFPSFKWASIFLISLAAFWVILATTIGAVVSIDRRYLENAETLEIPKMQKLFKIILPAASPGIFAGAEVALTLSFMMLAVAEMFGARAGLAFFVHHYSDLARFDLVLLGFLFTAFWLVVITIIFDRIKKRSLNWTINN
ncbi:MAG: ABC transporter permease subunit [Oscillospiraceae bacterium]|nr:ABC transporter permease subunit [Oscillospiraceae bacterium]